MRRLLAAILFISLAFTPYVTVAQKTPSEVAEKQRRAGRVADRFVETFRQTLDFGTAWKAFRLSDPSCTHRANGILTQGDYNKLKLSSQTIERLYVATMNYYYLMAVRELSLARIDSQSDFHESPTPREIEAIVKKSKFFQNDDRKPETDEEVGELISTFDQLARLYRKYLPKGAMGSAVWQANQKYLVDQRGMDHAGILNGSTTFCVPEKRKVYIVDRGTFYFYVVEEGSKMRVAGLGID